MNIHQILLNEIREETFRSAWEKRMDRDYDVMLNGKKSPYYDQYKKRGIIGKEVSNPYAYHRAEYTQFMRNKWDRYNDRNQKETERKLCNMADEQMKRWIERENKRNSSTDEIQPAFSDMSFVGLKEIFDEGLDIYDGDGNYLYSVQYQDLFDQNLIDAYNKFDSEYEPYVLSFPEQYGYDIDYDIEKEDIDSKTKEIQKELKRLNIGIHMIHGVLSELSNEDKDKLNNMYHSYNTRKAIDFPKAIHDTMIILQMIYDDCLSDLKDCNNNIDSVVQLFVVRCIQKLNRVFYILRTDYALKVLNKFIGYNVFE